MQGKIIPLSKRKESAADCHWNKINDAARQLVHLATLVNAALEHGANNDACKTLVVELVRLAADIMRHNYEVINYGYLPKHDDMIVEQSQVCLNILASGVWQPVLHHDFIATFNEFANTIQSTAQARRLARQEVAQGQQRQATK